jgi:hypothetical protein
VDYLGQPSHLLTSCAPPNSALYTDAAGAAGTWARLWRVVLCQHSVSLPNGASDAGKGGH